MLKARRRDAGGWSIRMLCLLGCLSGVVTAEAHGPVHERLEYASKQIASRPDDGALYVARAALYLEHADYAAVLLDLNRAEELKETGERIPILRAKALSGQGKPGEALTVLDGLIDANPATVSAYVARAEILVQTKRTDEAAKDLEAAIRRSTSPHVDLFIRRARLLETCGQNDAALACLAEGRTLIPGSAILQAEQCETALRAGNPELALQITDEILASATRKERWLALKAKALQELGRNNEARETIRAALAAIADLPARHRNTPAMISLKHQLKGQLGAVSP